MQSLMNKKVSILIAILAGMICPQVALAVPAYARQTGLACNACHFQSFPALNELGRSFKADGYTMEGKQQLIEGSEGLSLPQILNASVTTKIRDQKSNGAPVDGTNTTNDGQLQFPDELLVFVGGRVSENIGAQLELNLNSKGTEPVVENFKMPFIYDVEGVKAGVIPFTTATQGAAYGFELLNTGAVRGGRIMEARKSFSAQQYINTASAAEGIAAVASNDKFFASVSKWSPRSVGAANTGSPTSTYLRVVFTPKIGSWDAGIGVQNWGGSAKEPVALASVDTKAVAVDAQMQGDMNGMPVGFYFTYASANGTEVGGTTNLFNSAPNARTAITIAGQIGVLSGRATLLGALRKGDNGADANNGDHSVMLGATYLLVQNVQLQFNYERFFGSAYDVTPADGNQMTTFMLFAAF